MRCQASFSGSGETTVRCLALLPRVSAAAGVLLPPARRGAISVHQRGWRTHLLLTGNRGLPYWVTSHTLAAAAALR